MDFKDFRESVIDRCKAKSACENEFKALVALQNDERAFMRVLLNNHTWCIPNLSPGASDKDKIAIYTAAEIESLDAGLLLDVGILTAENNPIDFTQPADIFGLGWMPFNIGATADNPVGEYMDFDTAQTRPDKGQRLPTAHENNLLRYAGFNWSTYLGHWGMTFGKKVFLPAMGGRNGSGLSSVSSFGYYWSATPNSSTSGYYLYFYSTSVTPSTTGNRYFGFAARCVAE